MLKLSDIADVIDCLHETPRYTNEGYPVARVEDVNNNFFNFDKCLLTSKETIDYHNRSHVPAKGDILITRVGSFGRMSLIDENKLMCIGQNVSIISPHSNGTFLYYYLKSPYAQKFIYGNSNGSSYKSLSLEQIRNIPINDKGLDKIKISNLLYSIDKKIEANKTINLELSKILNLLYERWFLQFDFPDKMGKNYKSNGGTFIFDEYLKRQVPSGWTSSNLSKNSLTSIISPGVEYFEKKNYLATANIVENDITDGDWITFDSRQNRANMQPIKNSIWFAKMKNSVKHLSITEEDDWITDTYILSTGFCGLSINKVSFGYIHCFINSEHFEFVKNRLSHGATQQGVNNNDLKSVKLLIPPKEILLKFNNLSLPIIKDINNNYRQNKELNKLKEFLLPLLMNGQVGFKNP
ncbi:hypothetical protein BK010_07730 [Tenericutes bacterium MO-XQ]|nr:hypothetical protein BK010_07730 [Tenericutes bacterium MO-XQ]